MCQLYFSQSSKSSSGLLDSDFHILRVPPSSDTLLAIYVKSCTLLMALFDNVIERCDLVFTLNSSVWEIQEILQSEKEFHR
jgi:hypothetical protein